MEKLQKLSRHILILLTLATITLGPFVSSVETIRAQSSSASSSQPSATPVNNQAFLNAVAEALEELRAARRLIAKQDVELKVKDELILLERQLSDALKKKDALSEAEIEELRKALLAKDRVIAAYEAEIAVLKKRDSFWSKAKWFIVGAAAGIITGAVVANE